MLTRADGYPEPLRQSGPVWLLPDTASAPEAHPAERTPDAPRVRAVRRWPLFFIASPAAVAIWSGWVALGAMCGFGPVNLLPGIGGGFTLNTAITLPIGVEAYGAFALGAWLLPGTPPRARKFAMRSAIGSLVLGMTGQVIYHLLAAAHATRAPWPVTVVVACMPVATLGFGAALAHLMHSEIKSADAPETHLAPVPEVHPPTEPESAPQGVPEPRPSAPAGVPELARASTRKTAARRLATAPAPGSNDAAEVRYAALLAEGRVPSMRSVKADMSVGQDRAREIVAHLATRKA